MSKFTSVQSKSTLFDALNHMNKDGYGVCYVLENKKLIGMMTDGDIRRGLVKGISINDEVNKVMNKKFFSLPAGSSTKIIQKSLEKHKHIPITDKSKNILSSIDNKKFHNIPLVQPLFNGNEKKYLNDCVESGWISSQGSYVSKFEKTFGKYTGNKNTLAVSNGTAALHLALSSLGIGPGDEVIIPDFTFAAVINAVIYVGATPVFIDINDDDLTINADLISSKITKYTKAIIAVHLYGYACNMDKIMEIAKKNSLFIIEDCAEALGTEYKNVHVGSFGDAGTFSFFGNKTITTGEGGMVQFKKKSYLIEAKKLRDHGMSSKKKYWHEKVGFNYRLTNIQSAVGLAQMERVKDFVAKKREIAFTYSRYLKGFDKIQLPYDGKLVKNSYWLYTIVLAKSLHKHRDKIISLLKENDIEVRPTFNPLHLMPPYKDFFSNNNLKNSISISKRGISLPSSVNMDSDEIQFVCDHLVIAIHRCMNKI